MLIYNTKDTTKSIGLVEWIRNLLKKKGFELTDNQKKFLVNLDLHDKLLSTSYRQSGLTTMLQCYCAYSIINDPSVKSIVIIGKHMVYLHEFHKGLLELLEIADEEVHVKKVTTQKCIFEVNGVTKTIYFSRTLECDHPNVVIIDNAAFNDSLPSRIAEMKAMGCKKQIIVSCLAYEKTHFNYLLENAARDNKDWYCYNWFWYLDTWLNDKIIWKSLINGDVIIDNVRTIEYYMLMTNLGYEPHVEREKYYNMQPNAIATEIKGQVYI